MNIIFDKKTKEALKELIKNSECNNIRLNVAAVGCGKPAYEIYADIEKEDDITCVINDINFVISKKHERMCNDTEIKYDKEIYNNGFYIRGI